MFSSFCKKILRSIYRTLRKIWHIFFPTEETLFMSCVRQHLNSDFFFIQIGANDGVSFDPIHDLIKENRWNGILVEPLGDYMVLLKANYKDFVGLSFEQVAITPDPTFTEIHRIDPVAIKNNILPKWAQGVSSLCPDRNVLGKANGGANIDDSLYELIKQHTIKETIIPMSFDSLLDKYDVKKIDLLQIDTEGHDYQVIRSINFDKIKPSIIHAEFYNLPLSEQQDLLNLLNKEGYKVHYARKDILAEKRA